VTITNRVSLKSVMAGVTPIADVPDAPTIGAATNVGTSRAYNNGSATVAYTAAPTGGTATTFTATSTPGSFTGTGTSPITVTGLQSATSYTFTVSAANANGTLTSAASSSITATTVPQAPTIGTVSVTNKTTVSVPFTAGATGGSTITSYTVTSSPSISLSTSGTSSPLTVTGTFATNQAYTFTMTATNANGTSTASSASNSITPSVGLGGVHFINLVNNGSGLTWTGSPAADGSQNYIVVASKSGETTTLKTSKTAITWQRKLNGGSTTPLTNAMLSASDGSIYTAQNASGIGHIVKYNSSGTLQWQKSLTDVFIYDAVLGSDDSVYINGSRGIDGGIAIKINSSGTLQWSKKWGGTYMYTQNCAIDSSDNFYATGQNGVIKFNSSGVEQWRRAISPGQYGRVTDVSVDSSLNVYVVGYRTLGEPESYYDEYYIYKLNSSGTAQWYAINSGSNSIVAASDGTLYTNGGGLLKLNTSGVVQFSRSISPFNNYDVRLVGTDVLLGGYTGSGPYYPMYSRLPNDGSKTGTYTAGGVSVVYATGSTSASTTTIPSFSSMTASDNTTVTVANGSLTDSAGTATLSSSE
jgi:hypothetical protein